MYLSYQYSKLQANDLTVNHYNEQVGSLNRFMTFLGRNIEIKDISTIDLQNYKRRIQQSHLSVSRLNLHISIMKALFHWARKNDVLVNIPNIDAISRGKVTHQERFTFSSEQINKLLSAADMKMRAMIWLGLNCGFGCTDCAELKWDNLDLEINRVIYPRGKTGISRNLTLWPETVQALKGPPKKGELVFYTAKGNPWVWATQTVDRFGNERFTKEDALSRKFSKLLKKAGIKTERGVGFYTLRRTAATLAARSGDPFAVQRLLGHADLKMATTYVQDVSEQTDRVVNNMRKLIIQDGSSPDINAAADVKK
jgi:integrase